jgi:hypothetical protein
MSSTFKNMLRWFQARRVKRPRRGSSMPSLECLETRAVPAAVVSMASALTMEEGQSRSIAVTRDGTASELNQTLKVNVRFTDGTAKYGPDYRRDIGPSSILTFAPGVRVVNLSSVYAIRDNTDEYNQTFTVNLSLPAGQQANFGNRTLTATIIDKDSPVFAHWGDPMSVSEGYGFTSLPLILAGKTEKVVTVDYSFIITANHRVTYGKDFFAYYHPGSLSGQVIFLPGTTEKKILLAIKQDDIYEGDQPFQATITKAVNADGAGSNYERASVTIIDDDVAVFSIKDATPVNEGHGTTAVNARFLVSISTPAETDILIGATTRAGTAGANTDYLGRNGTITFPRGQKSVNLLVPIVGDRVKESTAENFYVLLSRLTASDTTIRFTNTQAKATIVDDDASPPPSVGIPAPISATHTPENGAGAVLFRWAAARDAAEYIISIRSPISGVRDKVKYGLTGTSFQSNYNNSFLLTPGTWYWKVRAIGADGTTSSVWSNEQMFVVE